ncbi:MAG: histidinol-phosphatase HisJ family protein [Peptococcaceae bacterium]|nr:histidinol-phosphatase HisJ family protein [Peptococcaceae bacterium]
MIRDTEGPSNIEYRIIEVGGLLLLDLHTHIMGHMDRPTQAGYIREFLERARVVGLLEIGFSDHDYYEPHFDFALIRGIAHEYPDLRVRLGIEFDYVPGREERIAAIIERYDPDYAIGSVHQINEWAFDMDTHSVEEHNKQPLTFDEIYRAYFGLVRQAAQSGLFQVIGHFDLIKINGMRPDSDVLKLADGALQAITDHDLCVEINTNGLNKPVREFYPETRLVSALASRGSAFTLGSDAHEAGRVGENIDAAANLLRSCGVRHVYSFERKKRIGYAITIDN